MTISFLLVILLVILVLDLAATRAILKADDAEPAQRYAQLALVWLVPAVGAVVVLAVHRPAERRRSRGPADVGDDYGTSGQNVRRINEALDGD